MGLANSPMHGAKIRVCSGNFVTARPVGIYKGVDLCHTGEVRRVDSEAIRQQLSINNIVLLSHLGYSPTGEIFNLAVEDVATQVAVSLGADKLILFGEDGGFVTVITRCALKFWPILQSAWLVSIWLNMTPLTRLLLSFHAT